MKDWFNKYKFANALFAIIVVQLGTITYMFAFEKEGFHQDDAWSYQFANGNYETGMGIATDKDGNFKNANRWVDSELVREYMEVQDGMEFHYDSVLCNMSIEKNPPLHSIFVHTVCSFFPNTFSWWYAYAVNVLAFIATMFGYLPVLWVYHGGTKYCFAFTGICVDYGIWCDLPVFAQSYVPEKISKGSSPADFYLYCYGSWMSDALLIYDVWVFSYNSIWNISAVQEEMAVCPDLWRRDGVVCRNGISFVAPGSQPASCEGAFVWDGDAALVGNTVLCKDMVFGSGGHSVSDSGPLHMAVSFADFVYDSGLYGGGSFCSAERNVFSGV